MSRALEAHMGDLLRRAYVIARQRADVGRRMPGMEVASCQVLWQALDVKVRSLCMQGREYSMDRQAPTLDVNMIARVTSSRHICMPAESCWEHMLRVS